MVQYEQLINDLITLFLFYDLQILELNEFTLDISYFVILGYRLEVIY